MLWVYPFILLTTLAVVGYLMVKSARLQKPNIGILIFAGFIVMAAFVLLASSIKHEKPKGAFPAAYGFH